MDVSIEIKIIGKIEQANIALNGLTIIAGENATFQYASDDRYLTVGTGGMYDGYI